MNHMLRHARQRLAATFILLSLGLLLFSGCDSESLFGGSHSSTDRALQILDPTSMMVAHVDVKKGFETIEEFGFSKGAEREKLDTIMSDIAEVMGFNPRHDIHDLFVSFSATENAPIVNMIAFLDFDQDTMTSRLNETTELSRVSSAGKTERYALVNENDIQFALVDGEMIIVSTRIESLDKMVQQTNNTDATSFDTDQLFNSVKRREHWVVVRNLDTLTDRMDQIQAPGQLKTVMPALKAIRSAAIGLDASGQDIEGDLYLEPNDSVDANDLASVFSGLRAAARLQLEREEDLMKQLEQIDISSKNGLVHISTEHDRGELMELFQTIGSRLREMAGNMAQEIAPN